MKKRPAKLSDKMLTVLRDMHEGRGTHHNCRGLSKHGGRSCTLLALRQRGLIDRDYKITAAGVAVVEKS